MTPPTPNRLVRIGVAATALFLLSSALLTALVFPPLGAADEGAHVAHAYAVSGGHLPSVLDPQSGGPYRYRSDRTLYTAHHPPLFPALIGPVLRVGNRIGSPALAVRSARLLSALFGAAAIVATAALLTEILPTRPSAAIAGAAFVAATPAFAHISGLVYNDALALAVTTAVSWIGLRILRLGPTRPRVIALALLATLASLTRISAVPIALAAVGVAFVGARRAGSTGRTQRAAVGWPLAATGLGAGWFYVHNLVEYGDVSGGDELYDLLDRRPRSIGTLLEPAFVRARLSGLWTNREWERGKYGVGPIDTLVELFLVVLIIGGLTSLLVGLIRRSRSIDPTVLVFGLLTAVSVLAGFIVHVTSGGTPHSRYLFGVLWLVGLAFALGLARTGTRLAAVLLATVVTASAGTTVVTLDQVLRNRDLPIGPWGDLSSYLADTSVAATLASVLIALGMAAGGAVMVWTYARLRAVEASSLRRTAPKTDGTH